MPTCGLAFFVYGPTTRGELDVTVIRIVRCDANVERTQIDAFDDDRDGV
jgi:hypothetical protein